MFSLSVSCINPFAAQLQRETRYHVHTVTARTATVMAMSGVQIPRRRRRSYRLAKGIV